MFSSISCLSDSLRRASSKICKRRKTKKRCASEERQTEQRGKHAEGGNKRAGKQKKSNKRQQNTVGTQWSRAQHTRTGCNCVVRDWPQRIPAGIAWWMGLAMTTSHPPPPFLLLTCSFLSLSSLSPLLALLLSLPFPKTALYSAAAIPQD